MRINVAVLDDYQNVASTSADWRVLGSDTEITVFTEHIVATEARIQALQPFDVIVAMRERSAFPASTLAALPRLRLIVTTGMRNAAVDVEAATRQGVLVSGTGGLFSGTSELTWGLIHSLTRSIPREDRAVREGHWQTSVGMDLAGATLGILGLGLLGQSVARVAHAFNMRVVAWSQNLTDEVAAEHGAQRLELDDLLRVSDVVTVHTQHSDRTHGLIGARELAIMKPSAFLINTSRGPIVDETALIAALHAGTIAGAGLDVFDIEPLPQDHPLRSAPNTVLTPHLGYVTRGTYDVFFTEIVEDIRAWLDGAPVRILSP